MSYAKTLLISITEFKKILNNCTSKYYSYFLIDKFSKFASDAPSGHPVEY
jgi:hypothetical protein